MIDKLIRTSERGPFPILHISFLSVVLLLFSRVVLILRRQVAEVKEDIGIEGWLRLILAILFVLFNHRHTRFDSSSLYCLVSTELHPSCSTTSIHYDDMCMLQLFDIDSVLTRHPSDEENTGVQGSRTKTNSIVMRYTIHTSIICIFFLLQITSA